MLNVYIFMRHCCDRNLVGGFNKLNAGLDLLSCGVILITRCWGGFSTEGEWTNITIIFIFFLLVIFKSL